MSDSAEAISVEAKSTEKLDDCEKIVEKSAPNEDVEKGEKDSVESEKSAEPSKSEETDISPLEQKIIRQIEYYFGDANLSRDKFLNEELKKDDGWVPLTTLLTFNRLKAMSEDAAVIMTALRKSTNDLLELKSDNSAIRRHPTKPLPSGEDAKQDTQKRLLYVKGFPTDLQLDDLIDYFDQYGGESVMLRRDIKKAFKGSVFVLFKTAEQAQEYLGAAEMKYKDTVLTDRLYKQDYYKKKQDEKLSGKQEEIKKKEEQKKKKEKEDKEELLSKLTRGAVLKVTGIEEGTTIDKIKEFFSSFGKIAWVDFEKGEAALIRYAAENEAKDAWEKASTAAKDGKVRLNDKDLSAVVLEGEEEEAHWKKVFESINNRFKGHKNKFGRGGQRGGYRGQKRRNAGDETGDTSPKKSKADA